MKRPIQLSLAFLAVTITGCGTASRLNPLNLFKQTAAQIVCTPQSKAAINQAIADSPLCHSLAPVAVIACIAKQSLADQVFLSQCDEKIALPPVTSERSLRGDIVAVRQTDPRAAMQEIMESVGYTPERAMRLVRRAGM